MFQRWWQDMIVHLFLNNMFRFSEYRLWEFFKNLDDYFFINVNFCLTKCSMQG